MQLTASIAPKLHYFTLPPKLLKKPVVLMGGLGHRWSQYLHWFRCGEKYSGHKAPCGWLISTFVTASPWVTHSVAGSMVKQTCHAQNGKLKQVHCRKGHQLAILSCGCRVLLSCSRPSSSSLATQKQPTLRSKSGSPKS